VNLGNTGNGFDFLIDPYRHGGQPASVTSVPYAVVVEEQMDGRVEGAFDTELVSLVEELDSVTAQALSGTLTSLRKQFTWGPDELDSVTAEALEGTLTTIRKEFTWGPDEIDAVMARARDGELKRVRIEINMPMDELDGVMAVALYGTLQ
jgi:hypothetical protein